MFAPRQTVPHNFTQRCIITGLAFCFGIGLFPILSLAQVTTNITSSGLGTVTSPANASVTDITGGTRPGGGPNLFHSLGVLNIADGDTANFLNNSNLPTDNIFSRITGGTPSKVFGTIRTTDFGAASLFLMNPNGIIFGPSASLDISGSLSVTTANYLTFQDGTQFRAVPDPATDPLLTAAPPTAFGFLNATASQSNSGTIHVEGQLEVLPHNTLTVIGRDSIVNTTTVAGIRIQGGTLIAPSGKVNVVSLSSAGTTISFAPDQQPAINPEHLGSIHLSHNATVSTDGPGGGTVVIRGGNITLESGATISSETKGNINAQTVGIDIIADTLSMTDPSTKLSTSSRFFANGNAGDISIEVRNLQMYNDAQITSSALFGEGHAGNIDIQATESITIENARIFSQTNFGSGHAGNISINAPMMNVDITNNLTAISTKSASSSGNAGDISLKIDQLNLSRNAVIRSDTDGFGHAGDITITATKGVGIAAAKSSSGSGFVSSTSGDGHAGDITVNTKRLTIDNGGRIESETRGRGQGGTISVWGAEGVGSTADVVRIAGNNEQQNLLHSKISTLSTGPGQAGNIALNVETLSVLDDGEITSRSTSQNQNAGGGGTISVSASNSINLTAATISTSVEGGNLPSGNILLNAAQAVSLNDGTTVTAESSGNGQAGKIDIIAGETIRIDNSIVTAKAEKALGGNVTLQASDLIHITNSAITTQVQEGSASAGSITIDPDFVVVQNTNIDTSANIGDGGDVSIIGNLAIFIDPRSQIDTSSQFGGNGTVDIRAPIQNLSETNLPLPDTIMKLVSLYAQSCASQHDGHFSSLVDTGKYSSLPSTLHTFLPSPLSFDTPNIPQSITHDIAALRTGTQLPKDRTWKFQKHTLTSILQGCRPS